LGEVTLQEFANAVVVINQQQVRGTIKSIESKLRHAGRRGETNP
jgi:hypothetical protein